MTYRKLRKDEWDRLKPIFEVEEWPLPDSNLAMVVVGEDSEGKIRGLLVCELRFHAEPIWIHPDAKGTVTFRGLASEMAGEVLAIKDKLPEGAAIYFMTSMENVSNFAEGIGFQPMDERVWRLEIK